MICLISWETVSHRTALNHLYDKVRATKDHYQPQDYAGFYSFQGMIGWYRSMIPSYAEVVFPLTEMIRSQEKSRQLVWSDDEIAAFAVAKQTLSDATLLHQPLPTATKY